MSVVDLQPRSALIKELEKLLSDAKKGLITDFASIVMSNEREITYVYHVDTFGELEILGGIRVLEAVLLQSFLGDE